MNHNFKYFRDALIRLIGVPVLRDLVLREVFVDFFVRRRNIFVSFHVLGSAYTCDPFDVSMAKSVSTAFVGKIQCNISMNCSSKLLHLGEHRW